MTQADAQQLLDRIGVLRHSSDLDLLLFFARCPRVLLASEWLARFLGYDLKRIARSLDVLLAAEFITRKQTAAHAARLYLFAPAGPNAEWVSSILKFASTTDGRRRLKAALNSRQGDEEIGDVREQNVRHTEPAGENDD